jgi:ribosomal protein S18 acetylase RimI-like enzyme
MIRPYSPHDLDQLTTIIQAGYHASAKRISAYFDGAKTLVYDDGTIRGFCAVKPPRQDHGHMVVGVRVYTGPRSRRNGIAGALWDSMWPELRESPAQLLDTVYRTDNGDTGHFFERRGFERWFTNIGLRYDGPRFPEPLLAWQPYDDRYFEDYLGLINAAFESMRRENDIKPYVIFSEQAFADKDLRKAMARNYENLFVFLDGQRTIGLTEIGTNMDGNSYVDTVGVAPDYHGRGIGRLITEFAVNRLRDRGDGPIFVDTVDKNHVARRLYESVGFVHDQDLEEARLWLR